MRTGVAWYIGCPNSGKTTLARAHACQAARENGWPILVVDTEGVAQLSSFPRARCLEAAVRMVWAERQSCSLACPTPDDFAGLLRAARRPGRVNLLVDEAHAWLNARSDSSDALIRLMRAHRHAKLRLFLTTQHLSGDIPQSALACSPELYVFRCTSPATLDRLRAHYGLCGTCVSNYSQFEYLRVFEGFEAR